MVVLAVVAALTPGFASVDNVRAILVNASVVGILAVAMTPIALSGNFFSLGIQQSVVLAGLLFLSWVSGGMNPLLAILLVLGVQVLIGAGQALVVSAGLNPVITTLAVGSVLFGAMSQVTSGRSTTAGNADISWLGIIPVLGIPMSVYLFVVFLLVMEYWLRHTVSGRELRLVGANRATAQLSGVSRRRATLYAFLVLGIGCTLGGVILSAQIGQVAANDFSSLTIDVLAAVLAGGTSIGGGRGSAAQSAAGAVFIALLSNVLLLHGLGSGPKALIVGGVVLAVVIVIHLKRGRSS
ncbi:ABC transporter permease [Saccharopolyspora spinosa]|uniref:ABC transporter permease n=1 Tax=Saccharopolyspora spinosa TaxID=60894 RepID=UPI00117B5894|nr:hypothetical protein [Saccharopolyspora spinosa]